MWFSSGACSACLFYFATWFSSTLNISMVLFDNLWSNIAFYHIYALAENAASVNLKQMIL